MAPSATKRPTNASDRNPKTPVIGLRQLHTLPSELSGPFDEEVEDVAHRIDHHPHALLRLPRRLSGAE
jgi:hypothetical protein